jgi:hypothetical protein
VLSSKREYIILFAGYYYVRIVAVRKVLYVYYGKNRELEVIGHV